MNIIPIGAALIFLFIFGKGLYSIYKLYREDKKFEKQFKQKKL